MYTEHYKVSKKDWQGVEEARLASMMRSSARMIGYGHAVMDGMIDVVIFWRI